MTKMRLLVVAGLGIALVGALALMTRIGPRDDATIVVGLSADITTFEPANISSRDNMNIAHHIFDSLFDLDANGGHVPSLASAMEVSDDGTEYTYTLRDGLTCHDGEALTAEDAAFSFNRIADPAHKLHGQCPRLRLQLGWLPEGRGPRRAARPHHDREEEPDRVRSPHRDQHPLQGQLRDDEPRPGGDRARSARARTASPRGRAARRSCSRRSASRPASTESSGGSSPRPRPAPPS